MKPIIKRKMQMWLDTHKPSCPICKHDDWRLPADFVRIPVGVKGPTCVLTVAFFCDVCGYFFFVDPSVMGIRGLDP